MKIFVITTNIVFTKKPEWLDDFRKKYDQNYEYHVTLKQPSFIEEADVSKLQEDFKKLL